MIYSVIVYTLQYLYVLSTCVASLFFSKDTSSCLSQGVVGVADLVAVGKFHHLWAHTGLHRCIQGGCIVGDATCMMWKLPIG